jgi:hypothetical protein
MLGTQPTGLAFGEPEDRLREMRERRSRLSLRSSRATQPHTFICVMNFVTW